MKHTKIAILLLVNFFCITVSFAQDEMPSTVPVGARQKISEIRPKISQIKSNISLVKRSASDIKKSINEIVKKDSNITLLESDNKLKVLLSSDILFDFDKYEIKPEAKITLGNVAKIISNFMNSKIVLEGHTDSKGGDDYNLNLSIQRADSVKNWFVSNANLSNTFESNGYGETRPVAKNTLPDGKDNPKGREKNRRVEIVINKTE